MHPVAWQALPLPGRRAHGRTTPTSLFGSLPVLLGTCFLLVPGLAGAQIMAERYTALALTAPEPPEPSPLHPDLLSTNLGPLPEDGRPLRALQVPRFLRPTHDGSFGFDDFLVLGDHPTVTFTLRVDDAEETWQRTATRVVAGHLVSVFRPRWAPQLLRSTLRRARWGVDRQRIYWGELHVPGATRGTHVWLSIVPPNIPESPVVQIDDSVQFASHVVNIRDSDFGDSRLEDGDFQLDLPEITNRFYEHFRDEYEVIAVLSHAEQYSSNWGAFHRNVRNDISGIGLPLFDRSADYGSAGVLQAVEFYKGNGAWAEWSVVLHEQGHQYGENSRAWESLRPPLDRRGLSPSGHTPLLFPGAVTYGAVLFGDVRVARQHDRFEIERTLPLVTYHPLTLYRMGLVPAAAVPDMLVFRDQGQFGAAWNVRPAPGTLVTGETSQVAINDLVAVDGVRRGPAARRIRRAVVVVSRGGLVPKGQMDVLNYFARRLGASSGVTSWNRYPSFAEATGGRATMTTDIRPLRRQAAPPSSSEVGCAKVGTRALIGVTLDREIGGCLRTGDTLRVSGRLTLDDRDDYDTFCLHFRRYPNADDGDRLFRCASLGGDDRFTLEVTFPVHRPGGYQLEAYAYWPGSGRQPALSNYTGAIELLPRVDGGPGNRPPVAVGTLADQSMRVGGVAEVVVGGAFRDPDGDPLTYEATSSAPAVASVQVSGSTVTVRAGAAGIATVTVTATDVSGSNTTTTLAFRVTVAGAPVLTFTDDPILPGVTPIKAVHFTELRQRIDALRSAAGLLRFSWTDPVLRAGVTPVRRVHLLELRSALSEAYEAAGRAAPRWTDASPASTPIRAAHVTELRAAVLALE